MQVAITCLNNADFRLYGGIHFRDAVEQGMQEGEAVGKFICEKIRAAGVKPLK